MNIPLAGGPISGSVSGTCEGRVTGSNNGGSLTGSMSGACSPFIMAVPASATFSGSVNKAGKTVPVSFSGKGGSFTHNGSLTLTYP